MKAATRKFCKGWGANVNSQIKREKKDLLKKLQDMDGVANERGLDASQWQERYEVEEKLERIYQFEEIQWQRRGSVNWILKGDTNNGYFHNVANGRKKKCTIFSLEDGTVIERFGTQLKLESIWNLFTRICLEMRGEAKFT
jgi:hypothetical protein